MAEKFKFDEFAENLGRQTQKVLTSAKTSASQLADSSQETWDDFREQQKPLAENNWYERTSDACEKIADAIMHEKGWTEHAISITSKKLALVAVPASVFSVAALVGTASTGTAIGSLNGAAFTSSALAWIGGSVAMGTAVVGAASIVGFLAAPFALKPVAEKYLTGNSRNLKDLNQTEKSVLDACTSLVMGLRQAHKENNHLANREAKVLIEEALSPLLIEASNVIFAARDWPIYQRNKLKNAYIELAYHSGFASNLSNKVKPLTVGIATVLMFKLLSDDHNEFTKLELDILEAIKRSTNELTDTSNDEIANYVQLLEPSQLIGFQNNVKGIAHEISYARHENADGDEYFVELFEATNHAGSDIRVINSVTGEVEEFQLKATAYASYIESHFEKYKDIPVMATSEVAASAGVETTGVSNEELEDSLDNVIETFRSATDDNLIYDSLSLAGVTTLAHTVGSLLKANHDEAQKRKDMVQTGIKAGLLAGTLELLI